MLRDSLTGPPHDAARFTVLVSPHSTTIFKLCTGQKQLEEEIYNRYKAMWARYFDEQVVPALQGLSSQEMLLALHSRYSAHKKMTKYWSGIFFKYLDKYYTPKKNCPSTKLVGQIDLIVLSQFL